MSKTTVTIRACDICGQSPATGWRLVLDNDAREIDLCTEHGKPLVPLFKKARARRKIAQDVVRPPRNGPRTLRHGAQGVE